MSDCYLVTAYRWGWTNNGCYHVGCWTDLDTAIAFADKECADRGGKYGVEVVQFSGESESSVHYQPSSYGEETPHFNERIELFERFGNVVVPRLENEEFESLTFEKLNETVDLEKKTISIFRKSREKVEKA